MDRKILLVVAVAGGAGAMAASALATDTVGIPAAYQNTRTGNGLNSIFQSGGRAYQHIISEQELATLPTGAMIEGITWRVGTGGTWPASNAEWSDFEIRVSTATTTPGTFSTTFAANEGMDVVVVRSGPLTIPAQSFPSGAPSGQPNPYGHVITFQSPFVYNGGGLTITIRHTGSGLGSQPGLDAVTTSMAGYGSDFAAIYNTSNPQAATGTQISFCMVQLTYSEGAGCYADCDGNELLNVDDFICFINEFAQAQGMPPAQQITHYANCDGSTSEPVLTVDDFICFINEFAQGCP